MLIKQIPRIKAVATPKEACKNDASPLMYVAVANTVAVKDNAPASNGMI